MRKIQAKIVLLPVDSIFIKKWKERVLYRSVGLYVIERGVNRENVFYRALNDNTTLTSTAEGWFQPVIFSKELPERFASLDYRDWELAAEYIAARMIAELKVFIPTIKFEQVKDVRYIDAYTQVPNIEAYSKATEVFIEMNEDNTEGRIAKIQKKEYKRLSSWHKY